MFKHSTNIFIFLTILLKADNFEEIDLVLYNDEEYIRIEPSQLVIINENPVIFRKVDLEFKKALFTYKGNNNQIVFFIDDIKSLKYQEDDQRLLHRGALVGAGIYAWWGYLQSSGNYRERNDKKEKVFIFTSAATGFGFLFGAIISYPIQKIYNYYKPIWSDTIFINNNNWRILN